MIRRLCGIGFVCLAAALGQPALCSAQSSPTEGSQEKGHLILIKSDSPNEPVAVVGRVQQKEESAHDVTIGVVGRARAATDKPNPWSYSVAKSFSSIYFYNIADSFRAQLKLPRDRGMAVAQVDPKSPESEIGLRPHDILLSLGDHPLANPADLVDALGKVGDKPADLVLLREGQKLTIQVQPRIQHGLALARVERPVYVIGLITQKVNPLLRAHLKLAEGEGLDVNHIDTEGPANKVKIAVGDILLKLNGKPVGDEPLLSKLIQENGEKPLVLELLHEGDRKTVSITPEKQLKDVTLRLEAVSTGGARPRYHIVNRDGVPRMEATTPFELTFTEAPLAAKTIAKLPSGSVTTKAVTVQGVEIPPAITFRGSGGTFQGRGQSFNLSTMPGNEKNVIGVKMNPAGTPNQAGQAASADPTVKRLDELSVQVDALRKAVEDLNKILKEKK